jgi:hypothetical protein
MPFRCTFTGGAQSRSRVKGESRQSLGILGAELSPMLHLRHGRYCHEERRGHVLSRNQDRLISAERAERRRSKLIAAARQLIALGWSTDYDEDGINAPDINAFVRLLYARALRAIAHVVRDKFFFRNLLVSSRCRSRDHHDKTATMHGTRWRIDRSLDRLSISSRVLRGHFMNHVRINCTVSPFALCQARIDRQPREK